MDNNYIQLCAEMAYNDSLLESFFEENALLEADNKGGFKEKIKKFFEGIKNFIKNLFNKVIGFFKDCITKLQAKFSKNESASLHDSLMEMVLTEAHDLGVVAVSLYEQNESNLSEVYNDLKTLDTRFFDLNKNAFFSGDPDKFDLPDKKETIDTWFKNIEDSDEYKKIDDIEKDFDDIMESHKNQMTFEKKADDHLIRYFHRSIDIQNRNLKYQIESCERSEKDYDKISNEKEGYMNDYYSLQSYFYSRKLKVLSKIEKGYATLLRLIIQIANKSKIKNLKTEEPDGTTSYRI